MSYLDIGEGDALVLIHGLGSTKESWHHQHALTSRYRLIIPDLRGHGASTNENNISIDTFANDVLGLLDTLGIEKAHFCGLSMGGVVVQEIYRKEPKRVSSMILSNTFSYVPYVLGFFLVEQGIKELRHRSMEELAAATAAHCVFEKSPELIKEVQETFCIRAGAYIPSSKSAIQQNYLHMLPFVNVPVLVIGATHDPIIPISTVYQTAFFVPKSEVYVFEKCGHMPNFEKPEEYNELLVRFLTSQTV